MATSEDPPFPVFARIGRTGLATELVAGGHRLVGDEPRTDGGTDTGPTPHQLLLASLGACVAMTLRLYADRKGWPLEAASVALRHSREWRASDVKDGERTRIERIECEVALEGPLSDEQRERLLEIAQRCPVHRTLEGPLDIVTRPKS